MRFNDLLRTVLANMGDGSIATVTRWRQCIDLLAQYDVSGIQSANALSPQDRDAILAMVAEMRPRISVDQRIASVVELGGRLRSPGLVRLLSQDHPSLVSAMMANVRLSDADWASIIADLGPLARSVLRRRTDMGLMARAILHQFGTIDLTLTSLASLTEPPANDLFDAGMSEEAIDVIAKPNGSDEGAEEDAEEDGEQSQIGRIVAQIERFTEARHHAQEDEPVVAFKPVFDEDIESEFPTADIAPPVMAAPAPVSEFTFEADVSGLIELVSGAPRGVAIGLSIGTPSMDSRDGADGLALGAFRRRAAFENARFSIGEGLLAGEWRMSAEPRFDRASGRFLGYVGSARREFPHEALVKASEPAAPSGWAGLSAAGTRQLIHELRTPLNAIQGYAEMIEAQLVGPVSSEYRDMARRILADAHALLATFDDLDLASRIVRGDDRAMPESIDLEAVVRAIVAGFGQGGSATIVLSVAGTLPLIGGDRAQIERMLSHLLRAGCGALGESEALHVRLAPDTLHTVRLSMQRPLALRDLSDDDLLDHGYFVDHKLRGAPPLGLAFTLKLVRGIAAHLGGYFDIGADAFGLVLPTASVAGHEQENLR